MVHNFTDGIKFTLFLDTNVLQSDIYISFLNIFAETKLFVALILTTHEVISLQQGQLYRILAVIPLKQLNRENDVKNEYHAMMKQIVLY